MAWKQGRPGGGGGGDSGAEVDAIRNITARHASFARWGPAGESGFPAPIVIFSDTSTSLPADAVSEDSGSPRLVLTRGTATATFAIVWREALDPSGNDGNRTLSPTAGWELLARLDLDAAALNQWFLAGGFNTAGSFPFPDTWSIADAAGVGFTTRAPATPVLDLEVMSSGPAAAFSRASLANARNVGARLLVSARQYPASDPGGARIRGRVLNLDTNVEVENTVTTNLPTAMMHAGIIHNVGATPVGSAGLTLRSVIVGYP